MISVEHLTVRFGAAGLFDRAPTVALDDLTVAIPPGRITGVLGRNGAGKSTLFRVLAGYLRPTSGDVDTGLDAGGSPYENPSAMNETLLARPAIACADSESVDAHLALVASARPRWDAHEAERLLDRFEVPRRQCIGKLSTGKQAAVAVTCALASGCPLTMLDETHLGMDAPTRYAFYEELLAAYGRGLANGTPRTFLVSTHIIDEIADVINDVVIIDRGRLLVHDEADDLRGRGAEVTGNADAVDDVTFGLRVLSSRSLGRTKRVVVYDELNGTFARRAADAGVDVGPLPLQDLFVALTGRQPGESGLVSPAPADSAPAGERR